MIKPNHFNAGDKVAIVSLSSGMLGEEIVYIILKMALND